MPGFSWLDYLEQEPRAGYFSDVAGLRPTPTQDRFFQNSYQDIFNKYLGALGTQIRGGQQPTLSWMDYLAQNPLLGEYRALSPSARGEAPQRYDPRLRWLTQF